MDLGDEMRKRDKPDPTGVGAALRNHWQDCVREGVEKQIGEVGEGVWMGEAGGGAVAPLEEYWHFMLAYGFGTGHEIPAFQYLSDTSSVCVCV